MSRLTAIRDYCYRCVGKSVKERRECTDKDCLFYPWRLGKRRSKGGNSLTPVIHRFCTECMGADPDKKSDREAVELVKNCKSTKCKVHSYRRPPQELR